MILPTLPEIAKSDASAWNAQGKRVARRILDAPSHSACSNCAGLGEVIVSFLGAGPTKTPLTSHKPSTYIKDEGWYLVEATKCYACPVCSGEQIVRLANTGYKQVVLAQTKDVADRLTSRADIEG